MVCQDYFRQLPPELFYINANPLRGRHFVQRSQGCGEDGREEGTATETAGGILSTSCCSRFCAGRQHPVRKLRECEEMTPTLFFSQKEGHSSLSHRHVTFRPEKGPHFYGRAWGLSGTLWVLSGGHAEIRSLPVPGSQGKEDLQSTQCRTEVS